MDRLNEDEHQDFHFMYGVCCLYFILARFLVGLGRVAG